MHTMAMLSMRKYHKAWRAKYDKTPWPSQRNVFRHEWRDVWHYALNNMPHKLQQQFLKIKVERPRGVTPIGDYAEGVAKGDLNITADGTIWEYRFVPHGNLIKIGQPSALGLLLGYICQAKCLDRNGRPYTRPRVDTCGLDHKIRNGWRPRDPVKRALLLKLAEPDGKQLAHEMMTKLGIAQKYIWEK